MASRRTVRIVFCLAASLAAWSVPHDARAAYNRNQRSNLLFTYVTTQSGLDTRLVVANTTADPFGTRNVSGACTFNFFGTNAPSEPVNESETVGFGI